MRIIPAIDLKGGVVVRGVAGRREHYLPLQSLLAPDAKPTSVARGLIENLGLREFYVADLDAIGGGEPDWASYEALLAAGGSLWIDAGVNGRNRAWEMSQFAANAPNVTALIVALESIEDTALLDDPGQLLDPARWIFSLDLAGGKSRAIAPQWQNCTPLQIGAEVAASGVRRFIVLDVAAVGIGQGCPTLALCRELRHRHPEIELSSGGGIRSMGDVQQLSTAGCDAALVATALHDGRINRDALAALNTSPQAAARCFSRTASDQDRYG